MTPTPIRFWKDSKLNTPLYYIEVFGVTFTISYETVIAVSGRLGGNRITARLDNTWGRTTGRHMIEAGVKHFPVVDDEKFNELCTELLLEGARNNLLAKMGE